MRLELKVYKRSKAEWLAYFVFIMPFLFGLLNELMGLPRMIRYTLDIAWLILLASLFVGRPEGLYNRRVVHLGRWIFFYFAYTLIAYLFHFQSLGYYLWGFRNNFRFYFFFLACCAYIKAGNVGAYLKMIDVLFYINAVIAFFQFFVLGYHWDNFGGIFGVAMGSNAYLNLFLVIAVSKFIVFFMEKKDKLVSCVLKCLLALVIAAFAELKFFYAEFVIILILASLLTRFSWKKVGIIALSLVVLIVGISILGMIFPGSDEATSFSNLFESASSEKGYTASNDMNRLTVFAMSDSLILTSPLKKIFGLGLGNCDYADAIGALQTPFFLENGHLHYTWLSSAMVYLETGFVGLGFYIGFFVMAFFGMRRIAMAYPKRRQLCIFAEIVAVMCSAVTIYNSSLRTEAGYMAYFVLALPFCGIKPVRARRTPEKQNQKIKNVINDGAA